jgi:hypothetical protein
MHYDVMPPRSRADVLELVERRDVQYSSFAFVCEEPGIDDTWSVTEWNTPLRSLRNVTVRDVAPVLDPAYFDTSAASRGMTGAVESLARFVDAAPEEVRGYLAAGQAMRFFSRTDRPSAPKPVPALDAASAGARMLDDKAVALRNWEYGEADVKPAKGKKARPSQEETRAALKAYDDLCQKWTDGEPCVRPAGHDGDHKPICWRSVNGLPCSKPRGHEDEHEPIRVNSRSAGDESTETRDVKPEKAKGTPEAVTEPEPEERALTTDQVFADLAAMRVRQLEFEAQLEG